MISKFFFIFFFNINQRINKVLYLPPQKTTVLVIYCTFKTNDGEVAQLVRAHDS